MNAKHPNFDKIKKEVGLTYKFQDDTISTALGKLSNTRLHKFRPITQLQLETLRLKKKSTINSIMKKSVMQPNLNTARKQKASLKESINTTVVNEKQATMGTTTSETTDIANENKKLKIQIAQLSAIIEVNNTKEIVSAKIDANIPLNNRFDLLMNTEQEEERIINR